MRLPLLLLLLLATSCTGAPSVQRPASTPRPVHSPAARPQQNTEVLAVATSGTQVRAVERTCLRRRCQESLLTSRDSGRSFLSLHDLPTGSTSWSGLALGAGGHAAYLWQGSGRTVLWTADDGSRWTRSGPLVVKDLSIRGDQVWAVVTSCRPRCTDRLLAGRVGASPASWKALPLAPRPALDLSRLSTLTAFALGSGLRGSELLTTRDGGRRWSARPAPCPAGRTNSVSGVDARVVWVVCGGRAAGAGQVKHSYLSTDGGAHWTGPADLGVAGHATDLLALSSRRAFATGGLSAILSTTDGGRTWQPSSDYEDSFGPIAALSDGTLLAAVPSEHGGGLGGNGSVWRRPAGGAWSVHVLSRAG